MRHQGSWMGSQVPQQPSTKCPPRVAAAVCLPRVGSHQWALNNLNINFSKDKVSAELLCTYTGASESQTLPRACRMLWILWSKREIQTPGWVPGGNGKQMAARLLREDGFIYLLIHLQTIFREKKMNVALCICTQRRGSGMGQGYLCLSRVPPCSPPLSAVDRDRILHLQHSPARLGYEN